MPEQEKLSEIEWRRRMVVEAAADLAAHAFSHNNGDGSHSYLIETQHVELLRSALERLRKLVPEEVPAFEPED